MTSGGSSGHAAGLPNSETVRALAAHQSLLRLLHEGASDTRALARLAVPMTETDFLNMCEERSLANKCGNPLCTRGHKHMSKHDTAKIDWESLEILKVSVDQHWCSKECHIKCAQFAKSLGHGMDRLEVLQKLKAGPSLVSHHGSSNNHEEGAAMMKGILGGVKENSVPRAARASEVRAGIRVTREKQVMAAGTARGATPASGTADEDHSNKQPPQSNGCMPRSESPCQDAIGQQVDRDAAPKNAMGYKCEGPGGQTPIRRRSRATDLLKGLQRSLQQPGAAVHPDDFHFEEPEHAATPAQGAEVAGTGPAEPPYACRDAGHLLETVVSSALPAGCVSKDCASEADTDCGQQPSEAPSSPQVPSACPSSAPLAMHEPEVDGRGPGKPGRYRTVKGKFKPRPVETKAVPVNVSQELSSVKPALPVAQIGHAAAGQPRDSSARAPSVHVTGTTPTLPDSTASTDVLDATPSARKRVAFGSCQMYEFDPERPPADGGEDDCVCEVPLLPEAASSPLPGLPNNFMNAPDCAGVGHLWNAGASAEEVTHNHDPHVCLLARCGAVEGVSGVIERTVCGGTCPTVPEHESGHRGPASCSQTMQEPQGAVTERAGPVAGTKAVAADRGEHDEVTPVLYFDVHAHKSGGSLEGALRVTTAEALQLSEQDLAEMQAELESGHRLAAQEALDVQGEDAESSDGDDGESSEVEGAGERLPLEHPRRPRLRQRRSGAEAAEVAQDSLSAEQQHQMNQQAVADAFRYYLAPEAGGVGVATSGGALHELAADLTHRMSARKQQGGPAVEPQQSKQGAATTGRPAARCSTGACRREGTADGTQAGKLAKGVGTCNAPANVAAGADAEARPRSACTPASGHLSDTDDDSSIESWSQESDDSEGSVAREDDPPKDAQGAVAEEYDASGNGQSADGYFDAAASAKPRLSVFGVAWRLFGIWVCQATVLHLHRPDVEPNHCFPEHTRQGQRALTNVLLKRVAPLLDALAMPRRVRVALAEEQMQGLLATLDVRSAVPTMAPEVQDCLALVMLAAVSAHRMPAMSDALQPAVPQMASCLQKIGLTPELFTCLVDCLVDSER